MRSLQYRKPRVKKLPTRIQPTSDFVDSIVLIPLMRNDGLLSLNISIRYSNYQTRPDTSARLGAIFSSARPFSIWCNDDQNILWSQKWIHQEFGFMLSNGIVILSFDDWNSEKRLKIKTCIPLCINSCCYKKNKQRDTVGFHLHVESSYTSFNKQIITTLQFSIFNLWFFHIYSLFSITNLTFHSIC